MWVQSSLKSFPLTKITNLALNNMHKYKIRSILGTSESESTTIIFRHLQVYIYILYNRLTYSSLAFQATAANSLELIKTSII